MVYRYLFKFDNDSTTYIKPKQPDSLIHLHNCSSITAQAVNKAVLNAQNKIKQPLFENLKIHVAGSFSDLNVNTPDGMFLKKNHDWFVETRGIAMAPTKEIFIQDKGFISAFDSITPNLSQQISNDAMHEIGHVFDSLGDHNDKDVAKRFLTEIAPKYLTGEEFTEEEKAIDAQYYANNEYSDNEEFKEALLKDFQNADMNLIKDKFTYYVQFFMEDCDNMTRPTKDDIENGETSRCEIFAQTFAYAMGEEDEHKEDWLKTFPHTFAQVKQYIEKHARKN